MDATLDRIKSDLDALTYDQRAELADYLNRSLEIESEGEADPGVAAAWEAEIERRVREIDAGEASWKPVEQVLAELKGRLR